MSKITTSLQFLGAIMMATDFLLPRSKLDRLENSLNNAVTHLYQELESESKNYVGRLRKRLPLYSLSCVLLLGFVAIWYKHPEWFPVIPPNPPMRSFWGTVLFFSLCGGILTGFKLIEPLIRIPLDLILRATLLYLVRCPKGVIGAIGFILFIVTSLHQISS